MRDAGIGDETLDVGLREGDHGAVINADHAESHGHWREYVRSVREKRYGEAEQAIGAGFNQDTGQIDAAVGWRVCVQVRKPAMERNGCQFGGKGDEETQHQRHANRAARCGV